ncbi:unnamed protein product, partial [Mesorhabditis belari]|uniref:GDP-fucose protein O-fucosyltransferase 1 n=1 Tax=Mesorhabditis belari TaxID=2138241 RepID=A0AAF3F6Y1_9BILA
MWILSFLLFGSILSRSDAAEIDPKGYVIYCPCMGRFGNQVDQLLGTISFAKGLDRTLVLPPFIDFAKPGKAQMIPFEDVYQPKFLSQYLKVITLTEFKRDIAPTVWPKESRKALCWSPRESFYEKNAPSGCHAKEGNPFGPFWDYAGVDFVDDEFYGKIEGGYDLSTRGAKSAWNEL